MKLLYKPFRHLNLNMHGSFGNGTTNWITVLYKNKFQVELMAIPKILWITMSILSTNVFRLYEKLRYDSRVQKVKLEKPVFILGYPRSGTTYLHYLVSKDPQFSYCATYQVLMPNMFLTFGKFLQWFFKLVLPSKRLMDNVKMGSELPKEEEFAIAAISDASIINGFYFPKNLMSYFQKYVLFEKEESNKKEWQSKLQYFLKKVSLTKPSKRLLLKSPFNTGRVKEILEIFPDAKFIHIHRNPNEVYYSNEKLYGSLLPAFGFHKISNEEVEDFIFESYRKIYAKYFLDTASLPSNALVDISYESLVANPIQTLAYVYKTLELENFEFAKPTIEQEIASYKNYQTNSYSMDEKVQERIKTEWNFYFEKFRKDIPVSTIVAPLKAV